MCSFKQGYFFHMVLLIPLIFYVKKLPLSWSQSKAHIVSVFIYTFMYELEIRKFPKKTAIQKSHFYYDFHQ